MSSHNSVATAFFTAFVDDDPVEDHGEVEFHHIKPFSEDGPTEIANIGAVCKDHHRRIRTLSLSEFRDQLWRCPICLPSAALTGFRKRSS